MRPLLQETGLLFRRWPRLRRWVKTGAAAFAVSAAFVVAAFTVLWFAYPFPVERLARRPASPVVTDRDGRTMLALVGSDDQWRFVVPLARVSRHLIRATIAVEDKRFREHCGVDPLAVGRAALQNLEAGRVVSGASTLTMQVCRMMDGRPRTLGAKLVESFRALQLEQIRTKDGIIETYLNIAPYGGNVRGAEAASLFYFGKSACDLSLGEAALLAGLPQSPSRFRPDRHPVAARRRRETVLGRMLALGLITDEERTLASAEPIAGAGRPPVRRRTGGRGGLGFHAAALALARSPSGGRTTVDLDLQREVERLAFAHAHSLPEGSDLAVVVIDIPTGDILALIGSTDPRDPVDGQVNGAVAMRSPGSALKPFVYAAAFEAGRLAPGSIVYDVPIERGGWAPANFDRTFAGEVTAAEALRRSLNVPAILVAEGTGLARVVGVMRACGVALPEGAESRGGLGIAVGTVEVPLLDLTNAYATLGREGVRRRARLLVPEEASAAAGAGFRARAASCSGAGRGESASPEAVPPAPLRRALDPSVCAAVNEILSTRRRRPRGLEDLRPGDVPWFMWKTGTSSGRRDAWAVGHNGRCAIGVWAGCFSGAPRLEFVGSEAAEPLLARLFSLPLLRSDRDPDPPAAVVVRWPLPRPAELASDLRIISPAHGSSFLAVGGKAVIRPRANRADGVAWFLDGRLLSRRGAPGRLLVGAGLHELRCVAARGRAGPPGGSRGDTICRARTPASAVSFVVR